LCIVWLTHTETRRPFIEDQEFLMPDKNKGCSQLNDHWWASMSALLPNDNHPASDHAASNG
jgi:hypothetical protein